MYIGGASAVRGMYKPSIFPRGAKEALIGPIVELGQAIIALVAGELPEAPDGKIWFYDTPTGREMLDVRKDPQSR